MVHEPSQAQELDLGSVLRALYACEINCGLSSFWDGGWRVWIGDEMNGRDAQADFDRGEVGLIGHWLLEAAAHLYPSADLPWEIDEPQVFDPRHLEPPLVTILAAVDDLPPPPR